MNQPRAAVDPAAWDEVVDKSDLGWLWHRHDFQPVLATWPGRSDAGFAVVSEDDAVLAVVPAQVVERRVGGVSLRTVDVFGGPCMADGRASDPAVLASVRNGLVTLARRARALEVTASVSAVTLATLAKEGDPLRPFGFEDRHGSSWVVDLSDGPSAALARIQPRTRKYVRAAERAEIEVRPGTEDDLDAYYALHLETTTRTGVAPHPRAYFDAIWRTYVRTGMAKILVAEQGGRPLAMCSLAVYKQTVTYWTAASSAEAQALHANDVVLTEAIRSSADAGYLAMELGDAHLHAGTEKHRRISSFKKKFGGELRPLWRGRFVTATGWRRMIAEVADRRRFGARR
jgi:hypothetical protein